MHCKKLLIACSIASTALAKDTVAPILDDMAGIMEELNELVMDWDGGASGVSPMLAKAGKLPSVFGDGIKLALAPASTSSNDDYQERLDALKSFATGVHTCTDTAYNKKAKFKTLPSYVKPVFTAALTGITLAFEPLKGGIMGAAPATYKNAAQEPLSQISDDIERGTKLFQQ